MKILMITENFPPKTGGSGRWFWEIYSRMDKNSCLIAAGDDPQAHYFDRTHETNCKRWPLKFENWGIFSYSSLTSYLKLFLLVRNTLKDKSIDSIHCGRGLPEGILGLLAWKFLKIPYFCYVHGEELPTYHKSREYKYLSQLVYTNAHRIIVNSLNTRQTFIDHTGISDPIRILHPGVDTSYFVQKDRDDNLIQQLGWQNRKIILTVGRLQKRKGHDYVIQALKRIRESFPNILYAIVGDGEEREYLEQLVITEHLETNVQFLGRVDDDILLSCYQNCDLFILANREVDQDFEGFGMVLVEAQACGKPVIAGKSGGTAETMIPGETGITINARKIQEIEYSIITLLKNPEQCIKMGIKASTWAQSTFNWNRLLIQAKEIFKEV